MTTLLHAAQLLADSTATPTPDPVPDIKPIKPPFVTQLFHHGVVLWWIAGGVGLLGFGVLFLVLSY